MLESILLTLYAIASIALALYVRRTFRVHLDWSHPDMRRPVFDRQVRSTGGSGALGAADSVSTAALSSASPSVVMMAIIVIAGLVGAVLGAGALPALVGGIGHPNGLGLLALMVATLAWTYIGGCLALPLLVLVLALGLWPIIIGIGLFGFCAMALWQTFNSGHPSPFDGNGKWQAAFGARVDYNLCAAGTSLIALGNGDEISRKCKQRLVGAHPVEGRFAGVYSCGKGQRIAAVVDVRPFGPYRNSSKDAEFQFSDQPETMFPNGSFAGFVRPNGTAGEFRSDGLAWTQKPGPGWGKPDQMAITAEPAGGINVRLLNTPCTTLQAQRCEPAEAGRVPTCERELARQGVKLYKPRTLRELSQVIADQEARQGRPR